MKAQRIHLLNCPVDSLTVDETLRLIEETIQKKQQIHHTVVNAGKMVMMQDDPQLYQSVVEADLINADGMAVVWASRILGMPLPERVNGTNLMEDLVRIAYENNYKVFFLGARQQVVEGVVNKYSQQYSSDIIAGYRDGYFKPEEEEQVAREIAQSGAHILFVAISTPKKENFLHKYRRQLASVNFIMGVGGSFDVVSGKIYRAPVWMQDAGLEWLFRFIQEPVRMWKRYTVGNYRFVRLVTREYFKRRSMKVANQKS